MNGVLPPKLSLVVDILIQRYAVVIFHDDILVFSGKVYIVNFYNVRIVQHRDNPRFVAESPDELFIGQIFFFQQFYGDDPVFHQILRLKDIGHTPAANQLF